MSSGSPSSGSKEGFFHRLRNKAKNRLERPSKSAHQDLRGSSPSGFGSRTSSPLPRGEATPPDTGHTATQQVATDADSAVLSTSAVITPVDQAALVPISSKGDTNAGEGDRNEGLKKLKTALEGLHKAAGVFPPLQLLTGTLVSTADLFIVATENREDCKNLASDLENLVIVLVKHLDGSESANMLGCIENIVRNLEKERENINDINRRVEAGHSRLIKADQDAKELVRSYRRIESAFRLLQVDASMSIWDLTQKQFNHTLLNAMRPAESAGYDSTVSGQVARGECTKGTRTDVLSGMDLWSDDPEAAKVYWLNGLAGTGKTTIAYSLSAALESRKQLGASFFCTRQSTECQDANRIIPTIVYQLAFHSRVFQHALCKILAEEPSLAKRSIPTQFKKLLVDPLCEVRAAMSGKVVIVIDALDECGNHKEVGTLLDQLFLHAVDLPMKFFVASRPEPEVLKRMQSSREDVPKVLHLHKIERTSVRGDIELYLREKLATLSLTDDDLMRLVELADTLFIYAATTVRYIQPENETASSQERLQAVLNLKPESNRMYADLDALYTSILEKVLNDRLEPSEANTVQFVLWVVVSVREPVTIRTLALLAGIKKEYAGAIVQSLHSVLYLREGSGLVSTFHASFPDFLLNKLRSEKFCCNKPNHTLLLVRNCFQVMKDELRFNICNVESSFALDEKIEDLDERVHECISEALSYACRYWGDHLSLAAPANDLRALLEYFLSRQLLFWMEVLNLTKTNHQGISTLQKIQAWLQASATLSGLSPLFSDVETFVTMFSTNPMSLSTPHIYISALPLFHRSIPMLAGYWKRMRGPLAVEGTVTERMVAGSPDIWKAQVDERVTSPANPIRSVAFSPEGTRVVTGSKDGTICMWGAPEGTLVVGPFKGHTDLVKSVAFSRDGGRIVSGSADCTICVWNAQDGKLIVGPIEGHTKPVNAVAFSPNDTRIVSGSGDCAICVWDAQNGHLAVGPFKGHTDWVKSVAFSPDGTRIASGSDDCTICVWDAENGHLVVGPLKEHTDWVRSVAFSSDGTRIVSGSDDCTICVWSAQDGNLISGPLGGHAHYVLSVAFSSDGTRVVSSSGDRTICVWNVQDGTLVAGPFKWQTSSVHLAAFYPDGMRVVFFFGDLPSCIISLQDIAVSDGKWKFEPSGWVVNQAGQHLFWIPLSVHASMTRPDQLHAIAPHGTLRISSSDVFFGDNWSQCYVEE